MDYIFYRIMFLKALEGLRNPSWGRKGQFSVMGLLIKTPRAGEETAEK